MAEEAMMNGFQVQVEGTYVLLDDVVAAVRAYAQSLSDPDQGALIHELASWFASGEPAPLRYGEPVHEVAEAEAEPEEVYGWEPEDSHPGVERVEIYPEPPDDPSPKWYARSIDTGGHILKVTNGSFDQEWVIRNAQERWPGLDIHMLKDASEDSKWAEDGTRGVFPSKGPPVRRLWAKT